MRFHIPKFQTGNFSNFFMLGFRRTTAATTASLSEDSIIRFFHKYRTTFTLFILKKKRYHKKSRQETFFNSLRACLSFNMTSNASVYASLGYSGTLVIFLLVASLYAPHFGIIGKKFAHSVTSSICYRFFYEHKCGFVA